MADITGSLKQAKLYFTSGSWRIIPSGSATIGYSASAGIQQVHIVSMSANTNNIHTPPGGTGSYYIISGSTLQQEQPAITYVAPDVKQQVRVLPYSSSVEGKYFTFTGSLQSDIGVKHAVIYTTYTYPLPNTDITSSEFGRADFEPNFGIEETNVTTRTPDLINVSTLSSNEVTASYNILTGSADLVINVPVHVSASALQIVQETKTHLDYSSSYVTTTISQSGGHITGSLYGMVITNKAPGLFNKPTGSTSPPFTFGYVLSGSVSKVPTYVGSEQRPIIRVDVADGDSVQTMISSSIAIINGQSYTFLSASYLSPSTFKITNTVAGIVNAPTHNYARGIITSTSVSGSGTRGQIHVEGTADKSKAVVRIEIDPVDNKSSIISGSGAQKIYMSGSGEIGIGTTNPETDFDIRADAFKIRKKTVMAGIRMNVDGNLESYNNDTAASATGSELILKYSRGTTNSNVNQLEKEFVDKSEVQSGDILGAIRWVVDSGSIDERKGAEAGRIQIVAAATQTLGSGVTGKMEFKTSADVEVGPTTMLTLDGPNALSTFAQDVTITGDLTANGRIAGDGSTPISDMASLGIGSVTATGTVQAEHLKSTDDIEVADSIYHSGDTDTKISFTTEKIESTADSISFIGNVTASGDISSSGNIYSDNEEVYQISAYLKSTRMDKWWGAKFHGVNYYQWNQSQVNAGVGTMSRLYINTGFLVPKKCIFTGFQCSVMVKTGTANMPVTCSLVYGDGVMESDLYGNPTILHLSSGSNITDVGGTNYDTLQISSSNGDGVGTVLAANSMVYPRFKWGTDQTAANISGNSNELSMMLQFKYKLIK